MKYASCFLVALALGLSLAPASFAEDPVYFPDANLKAAVEAPLGKTSPTAPDWTLAGIG